MMTGHLVDVPGIQVGHAERQGDGWLTGLTVVLPPPGTLGAVDVRGGAPCTAQTDALRHGSVAPWPAAIVLTGGSGFGLHAAAGVQRWCADHGRGFRIGEGASEVVPIIPAAAIFDLGRGGLARAVPDADLGYQATVLAAGPQGRQARRGPIGAGTGAVVDDERGRGGIGGAAQAVVLPGGGAVTVGALAVVNAFGAPQWGEHERYAPGPRAGAPAAGGGLFNTTLVVVATDLSLDRSQLERVAALGHDGLARALRPVHTLADGDVVFSLSTGAVAAPEPSSSSLTDHRRWRNVMIDVHEASAAAVQLAVLDAVRSTARQTAADEAAAERVEGTRHRAGM